MGGRGLSLPEDLARTDSRGDLKGSQQKCDNKEILNVVMFLGLTTKQHDVVGVCSRRKAL